MNQPDQNLPQHSRIVVLAAVAALAVGAPLAACSPSSQHESPSNPAASSQPSVVTATRTETPTASAPASPSESASDSSTKSPASKTPAEAGPKVAPSGIRVAGHGDFDRVVVDFAGEGKPTWSAKYVDNPAQQASGKPITVAGDAKLNVTLNGTAYPFDVGLDNPKLSNKEGTGNVVAGVASGGTYEGRSQLVIGVNGGQKPFDMHLEQNPTRLVIDIHK